MKYYYIDKKNLPKRRGLKLLSIAILLTGLAMILYVFSPLILWQVYFVPKLTENNITSSIPKSNIVNSSTITSLFEQATNSINKDFNDAYNWFPEFNPGGSKRIKIASYSISIPKIELEEAAVSTIDTNLAKHLVNYPGTSVPGHPGNAVVFGHSSLPYFYNPDDYKTIFSKIHNLKIGDRIYAKVKNTTYEYKIYNISVVDATDVTMFSQSYDNSYLTLVTCTPPGTIWKRLVVNAEIEGINDYARL